MEPTHLLYLGLGIAGTWCGAELLIRGSVRLAIALGISPLVVGLTVVAFGTSSPEAVVSFVAAGRGMGGIAVGNVLGSNIANVGLILGIVSLLHPIGVRWREIRLDVYIMLGASAICALFLFFDALGRVTGGILLLLLLLLLLRYVRASRRSGKLPAAASGLAPASPEDFRRWLAVAQVVGGLILLTLGAHSLVIGAGALARAFGIPDAVVGATMVAVGTSLPELAASVAAILRGQHDIGIGNIVGSNTMNLLFVLGGVCAVAPPDVEPQARNLVLPVMLAFSLAFWLILARRPRVGRWEGLLLLAAYAAFAVRVYA